MNELVLGSHAVCWPVDRKVNFAVLVRFPIREQPIDNELQDLLLEVAYFLEVAEALK